METDISNPSLPFVHRLFHPFESFPKNLWQNKIPRSPFIKVTSKENKRFLSLFAIVFCIIPAIMVCLTVRSDVITSYYKLVTVDALRNGEQVQVSQLDNGLFVVPLRNLTVRFELNVKGRVLPVHIRNVGCDDFCLSETKELALQCFFKSFPDIIHGVLYLLESNNPLLNEKFDPKGEMFINDNNVHKLKFEHPSL